MNYEVYATVRVPVQATNEADAINKAGLEIEFGTDVIVEGYFDCKEVENGRKINNATE